MMRVNRKPELSTNEHVESISRGPNQNVQTLPSSAGLLFCLASRIHPPSFDSGSLSLEERHDQLLICRTEKSTLIYPIT